MECTGKYFISHCSDDNELINNFLSMLDVAFSENSIGKGSNRYCTLNPEDSIAPGKGISDELRSNLESYNYMIAIITDSYLRSEICLAEFNAFWFQQKTVIAIVFNGEIGIEYVKKILGNISYIDTANNKPEDTAKLFLHALKDTGCYPMIKEGEAVKIVSDFFAKNNQKNSKRSYIGSGCMYENIMRRCNQYGIHQVADFSLSTQQLEDKLSKCRQIFILSTTGANLINGLSSEFIPESLRACVHKRFKSVAA